MEFPSFENLLKYKRFNFLQRYTNTINEKLNEEVNLTVSINKNRVLRGITIKEKNIRKSSFFRIHIISFFLLVKSLIFDFLQGLALGIGLKIISRVALKN